MSKACSIKQKKAWGYKGTSAKYLVKGMKTYEEFFFSVHIWVIFFYLFFYEVVTILFLLCQYGVCSIDWCECVRVCVCVCVGGGGGGGMLRS